MESIRKNYKPESLVCPKCGKKLKYVHSTSAKTITFTMGKKMYIKNLGYICPSCKDHIYVSQTATKFALPNIHYSSKICFMIYYYKLLGYSREKICDTLMYNNIQISDRNIDNLFNKINSLIKTDYTELIKSEYDKSIDEFKQIKLSIDLISYNKKRLVIIRNQFDNVIIGCYYFDSIDDPKIKDVLSKYIKKNLPITNIITIRKDDIFLPLLKSLAPSKTKFNSFLKI